MTDSTQIPSGSRDQEMLREFQGRYGCRPPLWVRAPGRVELMGSHTDYNQGLVLTLSIDRDTWLAVSPRADGRVVIGSLNLPGTDEFELGHIERGSQVLWGNYVRAVAWAFQEAGYPLAGFDGLIQSTVPIGGGLSSSAALEVAAAEAFGTLGGWDCGLPRERKALLCQRAENVFVGANTGILDQYTAVFGRAGCALLLDCRDLTNEAVPIHPDISIIICDTRTKRELAGTAHGERRAACEEGARAFRRADLRRAVAARRDAGSMEPERRPACRARGRPLPLHHRGEPAGAGDGRGAARRRLRRDQGADRGLLRGGPRPVRDRRRGDGLHDGRHAGRPGHHRRTPERRRFRRMHGGVYEGRLRRSLRGQVVSAYRAASGLDAQVFAVRAGPGAGAVETE